jgi:hypothetical protein
LNANFRNGINKLIIPGGFFDKVMTIGRAGALDLIGRKYIYINIYIWASETQLLTN